MRNSSLATALTALCFGCGPSLAEQVKLRSLADQAAKTCEAEPPKTKVLRCQAALGCATAAQTAVKAIQSAQEARAGAGATSAQETSAASSYAIAVASCAAGGWR